MDIVERLREYKDILYPEAHEAADEIERLRMDAGRYRWLKANRDVEYGVRYEEEGPEFEVFQVAGPVNDREWEKLGSGPSLDAAIDAAMAQTHNSK